MNKAIVKSKMSIRHKMIIFQMALDGMPSSTISTYKSAFYLIDKGATSTEIGREIHMSCQSVSRHMSKMEKRGYVSRGNKKKWQINNINSSIRDPHLLWITKIMPMQNQ